MRASTAPFDKIKGSTVDIVNGGSGEIVRCGWRPVETWRVVFGADAEAGSHLNTLRVEVGAGASLLLLETYLGDDVGYVADTHNLAFRSGREDASVERVVIAEDGESRR